MGSVRDALQLTTTMVEACNSCKRAMGFADYCYGES